MAMSPRRRAMISSIAVIALRSDAWSIALLAASGIAQKSAAVVCCLDVVPVTT
jgi:hypothetical protein